MKMEAEARQKRQVLSSMQPNLHAVMHASDSCITTTLLIYEVFDRSMGPVCYAHLTKSFRAACMPVYF